MQTPALPHATLLLAVLSLTLAQGCAQQPTNSRYPLRLHVLAVDDTHPTARMQPNWCSASVPAFGGDATATTGGGDACSTGGSLSFGGDDDFSGAGRADLVTPPAGLTQALSFTYEGCSRVRVPLGFQGLPARWKKPGKLEVLIPSDTIAAGAHVTSTQRCTLTSTVHEFVYLRMRNGSMLTVTQEAFIRKPSLRVFLSGGSETLQPRVRPTVSVKQLSQTP